jgi:16S rRNA (cytosine1402-N4)-methyltransferase
MEPVHIPVLLEEVLENMRVKSSGVYVDGTLGPGGHAEAMLRKCRGCTLIGIDQDPEALKIATERLRGYNVYLQHDRFSHMKEVINRLGYTRVDGVLLDLGASSLQLKSKGRGFSFLEDEPLDMRMDRSQELTALTIVNEYFEKELATICWKYGEEKMSRKIARAIVHAREKKQIRTCRELSGIIEKAVGRKGRIHPATKTFQSLRIEVNKELMELSEGINAGINILKRGGRFCVLSYHSLEDRIVKHSFKEFKQKGQVSIITKKPLVPTKEERRLNPSSRSAKFRVAEKL